MKLQLIFAPYQGAFLIRSPFPAGRQLVNVAFHPGGSERCTCAASARRGVAAAQNSDWPFLVALTT